MSDTPQKGGLQCSADLKRLALHWMFAFLWCRATLNPGLPSNLGLKRVPFLLKGVYKGTEIPKKGNKGATGHPRTRSQKKQHYLVILSLREAIPAFCVQTSASAR